MIANYHTHTARCHHAVGTEREYIENAIQAGFKELGFSDHSPMPFPGDYRSGFRMDMSEAEEYFTTVNDLKEEYKKDIKIFAGLEAEYYPELFDKLLEAIKPYGVDYLIMGQHALYNEYDVNRPMMMSHATEREFLKQYVDQTVEGLKTGCYTYMAHPDGFAFDIDDGIYQEEMIRICLTAKELDIPLEINLLGLRDHRTYPSDRFFQLVKKVGNRVVLGCDAHSPDVFLLEDNIKEGYAFARKYGLTVEERLELVRP